MVERLPSAQGVIDPGVLGSSPTSGSLPLPVSLPLSLSVCVSLMNK